jgi:hypothetical protein
VCVSAKYWQCCRVEFCPNIGNVEEMNNCQILAMLQRRISANHWQLCRKEYLHSIGKVAEEIFSKCWQVADENISQILAMLQRRIFAKYWQCCRGEFPTYWHCCKGEKFPIVGKLKIRMSSKYCQ